MVVRRAANFRRGGCKNYNSEVRRPRRAGCICLGRIFITKLKPNNHYCKMTLVLVALFSPFGKIITKALYELLK